MKRSLQLLLLVLAASASAYAPDRCPILTDALNQVANITRNGTMTVSGVTPAPAASVTVNGQAAERYGDFTFARTSVGLSDGSNAFNISG